MVICNSCNTENLDVASYCKHCGNLLTKNDDDPIINKLYCSNCGKEHNLDAKYCSHCGIKVNDIKYSDYTTDKTDLSSTIKENINVIDNINENNNESINEDISKEFQKSVLPPAILKVLENPDTSLKISKKSPHEDIKTDKIYKNVEITESDYEWQLLIAILVKASLLNANYSLDIITYRLYRFCEKYLPNISKENLNMYINLALRNNNDLFNILNDFKRLFPKDKVLNMLSLLIRIIHSDFLYSRHDRILEEQIRLFFGISSKKFSEFKKSSLSLYSLN